ncbi:MAG TPA: GFA family protein [Myxococcota bacterium]|nr:GFA family protein [Myxococcota bacterium]
MLEGGCLCGGVRYEISGGLDKLHFCHCQMCRRGHGGPFASYAAVNPRDRRYTRGESLIARYPSSADVVRSFCSRCGSSLEFTPASTPEQTWISAGGFDADPGIRPIGHIYVESKAPWFEIEDDLPQHAGAGI